MKQSRVKNTVRYYLLIVLVLGFLFLSNDFGLTDVQKTAIVVAAGIDRQDDTFIITSQIDIPQSSNQGNASQAVQIVSRGKTVGEAFEEINANGTTVVVVTHNREIVNAMKKRVIRRRRCYF